jgi:hypothetical protein
MPVSAHRYGPLPGPSASGRTSPSPQRYLASAHVPSAGPSDGREHSGVHPLSDELRDFLATDADGFIGVVDEARADGTISIACGWFGRREVVVDRGDVERVDGADRELVLRAGLPVIAELRGRAGPGRRLAARLLGRSLSRR